MSKKIPIKKFSIRLIIFSAIMAALSVLFQVIFPQFASPALPFIVLFFFIISEMTLYILLREEQQQQAQKFLSGYILSRIIKFLSCFLFVLLYLIFCQATDRWRFAIAFLTIYFAYSIFEVILIKKEAIDKK